MIEGQSAQISDSNSPGIPLEGFWQAIEVVRRALSYRPYIKEAIFGERWQALTNEQRMGEFLTPRIGIFYPDVEQRLIPCIFMRVAGDEGPLVEVFFYPVEAAWSFLEEAREEFTRFRFMEWSDAEIEERIESAAIDMMLMMIDSLYDRSLLMMQSFTMETIAQWRTNQDKRVHEYWTSKGELHPKPKEIHLDGVLKAYSSDVRQLWKYHGQSQENWRKLRFVEEYEGLVKHWRRLYRSVTSGETDWREYAKAGKFEDTPDDLLSKLENVDRSTEEATSTRVSELALEHAARRVGLVKKTGVSVWARQKRKDSIPVSDYSGPHLFAFLKEGKELIRRIERGKEIQARISSYPVQEGKDPALAKKRQSLEQKLDYAQKKDSKESERKVDSSLNEKE